MPNRPILIIDDDPYSCELVTTILSGADFEVLSAPDGPSGLELARAAQPAVILLDMMMPGMDGISTCQHLKQDPALKDIPVVGITASPDLTFTEKAFRAGAALFLQKPFKAASLVGMVELALEAAQGGTPMQRRRRYPRLPAEVTVRCLLRGDTETSREVEGRTCNVSLRGLLLLLPAGLKPGGVLRLRLGLPEGPTIANGIVMWREAQPEDDGQIRHGVQLLDFVEDSGLVQYRRFLSQIAAGQDAKPKH